MQLGSSNQLLAQPEEHRPTVVGWGVVRVAPAARSGGVLLVGLYLNPPTNVVVPSVQEQAVTMRPVTYEDIATRNV